MFCWLLGVLQRGVISIYSKKPLLSLQTKIILLVCCVVASALLVTSSLITRRVENDITSYLAKNSMNIARIVASSPIVIEGLAGERDEREIQEYANRIRSISNVLVIGVVDMEGKRKSHPDSARLGRRIIGGDEVDALRGE